MFSQLDKTRILNYKSIVV